MRTSALVLCLVGCMGGPVVDPATTAPRTPQIPLQPQISKLPNGMTVMLVPDASADLVSVMVRYRVGTIDTAPGQESLAHLAAHVSYVGPTGDSTLWDQLDRVGTWIDLNPDVEHTDFTEQCQPQQLGEVLRLEAQ